MTAAVHLGNLDRMTTKSAIERQEILDFAAVHWSGRCLCRIQDQHPSHRTLESHTQTTPSSQKSTITFNAILQLLPTQPRFARSDNGSEFLQYFPNNRTKLGIQHRWTYPRRPKMNAHMNATPNARIAPSKRNSWTITNTSCSPISPHSTEKSSVGQSHTIPSDPITTSHLKHPCDFWLNINLSAKDIEFV